MEQPMNDLLKHVLDAYGGLDRWHSHSQLSVKSATGGPFWPSKGIAENHGWGNVTIRTASEWTRIAPYGAPDRTMTFAPERVVIEDGDRQIVQELVDPRAAFKGYGPHSYWDASRQAYFNGYALWTYLATPFLLAQPGVELTEGAPSYEDGEVWRVLDVLLPETIASHSAAQRFYFGPDYLLRRQDYRLDVSGGTQVAHYVSDFVEVEGLRFPSKRRAYPRGEGGQPDRNQLLVWIRFDEFRFD
jgi:hypothetical protein